MSFNSISNRRSLLMAAIAMSTLFVAQLAHAQFRTSIQGTVTDPDGLPVPGATLTLKDLQTNDTIVRTADDAGVFNFNALPPDHFTLTVEKAGFQQQVLDNLQLIPEQANSLNVKLAIGVATTTVSVDASLAPALDTQTANTGQTISDNQIQHIPVYQRDVTSLIQLAPGVLATGAQTARRRWIPGSRHPVGGLIGRRRQFRTLEQYLCDGKWRFGQRQRRPVPNQRLQHRRYQHRERRLGRIDGRHSQSGFGRQR